MEDFKRGRGGTVLFEAGGRGTIVVIVRTLAESVTRLPGAHPMPDS